MRDLVVFALFIGVLPMCFLRPWVGLCAFTWLAYNRTQDLTWGFARGLPISQFIAIFFLLGFVTMEARKPVVRGPLTKAALLLLVWVGLSMLATGMNWDRQGKNFSELAKVILISILTGTMIVNRARLRVMMAVISLGLGFFGFKNGVLLMFGSRSIIGPGGMMTDNNDFALALAMNMPFLFYLADEMRPLKHGRLISRFMRVTFFFNFLAIMSTGSRGGFLATVVGTLIIAWKTKWKVPALAGIVLGGLLFLAAGPAEYRERLSSIFSGLSDGGEMDESAKGRLVSWTVAFRMVNANPVFGIGLQNMVKRYPDFTEGLVSETGTTEFKAHVAHNSYLQIMAESGYPAYVLFMFILVGSIVTLQMYSRRYRGPVDEWVLPYCRALQISLLIFMIGGTFLSRSHFDLVYQLVFIISAIPAVVAHERVRDVPQRSGPRVAQDVSVAHRDPFVRAPSR